MRSEASQQTREKFTLLFQNCSNSACDVLAELDCRNPRRAIEQAFTLSQRKLTRFLRVIDENSVA